MIIQQRSHVDILIVGAGPVGLFLANECTRRGLRWRLVEAHASQSMHSKALAIFPRTLEILDMAGLVEPFLRVANRVASVAIISHRRRLARLRFAPEDSPYPFIAMVPQDVTERLLVEHIAETAGRVEYETALVSAVDRGSHVVATLERGGDRLDLTATFLVGCDGAHSTVRHLLGLPFSGGEYEDSFMLADVETNDALPAGELQLCPSEFGPVAIFPMSATRRRIVAIVPRIDGDAPSLDLVREILTERGPAELEARALNWSSYFRVHHRRAANLRVGRFFIAGDAAHIHSPYGGQGMNTGLHDIWNLAWKLDLVIRGFGSEQLLDSYAAERIPVIDHVIQTTHTLTRVMSTPSHWANGFGMPPSDVVASRAVSARIRRAPVGAWDRVSRQSNRRRVGDAMVRRVAPRRQRNHAAIRVVLRRSRRRENEGCAAPLRRVGERRGGTPTRTSSWHDAGATRRLCGVCVARHRWFHAQRRS